MKITLDTRPLSVNQAWQGRRYKTKAYKQYERDISFLIPGKYKHNPLSGKLKVSYRWHLTHHATTDFDNPIKPIQDILQKNGVIEDDRFIYEANIEKIPSDENYVEIEIEKL